MKKLTTKKISLIAALCFGVLVTIVGCCTSEKHVVYAAAEGTMISNAKEIEFGETYYTSWTSSTDHLNYYCKIEVPSNGILSFSFTKPYDSEGEYGKLQFALYNEDEELIFDPVGWYTVDNASSKFKYEIGLEEGTYYLTVKPWFNVTAGTIGTTYSMDHTPNEYCELEPNDTLGSATNLEFEKEYTGFIGQDGAGEAEEDDYFKVKLEAGRSYRISVGNFRKFVNTTAGIGLVTPSGTNQPLRRSMENQIDEYGNNCAVYTAPTSGTYYVQIGNYSHAQFKYTLRVVEVKTSLSKATVTLVSDKYDYTGDPIAAKVTVKLNDKTLVENVDYKLTYEDNINVGKATVIITGIGGYKDSLSETFNINRTKVSEECISLSQTLYTYDGTAKKPKVIIKVGNKGLVEGVDFKTTYSSNTKPGKGRVQVEADGNYFIYEYLYFTITKPSIEDATVTLSQTNFIYDGYKKEPKVTVKYNGKVLVKGTDYYVSYRDNYDKGTAKVIIEGKGNYQGSQTKTFTISDSFTSGAYKYKVTGDSTVEFKGIVSAKTTTVKIADTVKFGGKKYKITAIANKALYKKNKVKKVTIGKNVTTIGKSAFEGCTKLSSVTIGSKVKKIGDKAFKKCTALTKITIPSKVETFGKEVFYGCKKLKTITVKSTKIITVGKNVFKGIHSKATIKVPSKKLSVYKYLFKGKGQGKKVKIKK